jgi:hypothetical protein
MHHPMRQDPHIRVLKLGNSQSALHALREHREDLPGEALDFRIIRA